MVNNQVDLAEGVDFVGITTEVVHGGTHSSEINDGRHSSEILQQDTCGLERNFFVLLGLDVPVEDSIDVLAYINKEVN